MTLVAAPAKNGSKQPLIPDMRENTSCYPFKLFNGKMEFWGDGFCFSLNPRHFHQYSSGIRETGSELQSLIHVLCPTHGLEILVLTPIPSLECHSLPWMILSALLLLFQLIFFYFEAGQQNTK